MQRTLLSVAVAQALMARGSVAQALNETIVGCAEVDCPTVTGSTAAECQLADKTFSMIGLARIPTEADTLDGLSWVEGVQVSDASNGNRTFDKSFYLGTPPSLSLNGTGACALFFTNVSSKVAFDEDDGDESTSQGTCAEAMSEKCVSALVSRAESFNATGTIDEICKKLQQEFADGDNFDSECASFSTGSKWVGLEYTTLSGSDGVEPITTKENSSSECWPITPKSYDLSFAKSIETEGDYLADTLTEEYYAITPILTLFFPKGSSDVVSKAEAQLTCMKTVDTSNGSNSTQSSGSDDEDNGCGTLVSAGPLLMSLAAVTSLFLLL